MLRVSGTLGSCLYLMSLRSMSTAALDRSTTLWSIVAYWQKTGRQAISKIGREFESRAGELFLNGTELIIIEEEFARLVFGKIFPFARKMAS